MEYFNGNLTELAQVFFECFFGLFALQPTKTFNFLKRAAVEKVSQQQIDYLAKQADRAQMKFIVPYSCRLGQSGWEGIGHTGVGGGMKLHHGLS